MMSGGKITRGVVESLLLVLNGSLLVGLSKLTAEVCQKRHSVKHLLRLSALLALSIWNAGSRSKA